MFIKALGTEGKTVYINMNLVSSVLETDKEGYYSFEIHSSKGFTRFLVKEQEGEIANFLKQGRLERK